MLEVKVPNIRGLVVLIFKSADEDGKAYQKILQHGDLLFVFTPYGDQMAFIPIEVLEFEGAYMIVTDAPDGDLWDVKPGDQVLRVVVRKEPDNKFDERMKRGIFIDPPTNFPF
jgi:hypothetical protein